MSLKIILSPDAELVEEVNKQLKENKEKYGKQYCPCALIHNADTVCMCKEFRDMNEPGECHCGKYQKILVD